MTIRLEKTNRGFAIGRFEDRYGRECSIQESSLADESCLWLGADDRMHLTRAMAADLIPLLQEFADTGRLRIPGHWSYANPWQDQVVYVTLEELAECDATHGERIARSDGTPEVLTTEKIVARWRRNDATGCVDAYLLPDGGPMGISAGVRFGPRPEDYLSLYCDQDKLAALLKKVTGK
jgi:hypothetical protein